MKTNKEKVRNIDIKKHNPDDNPVTDQEAQNVTENKQRLSGEDAKKARQKATEGIRQDRADS
jgi:hypothetical protein